MAIVRFVQYIGPLGAMILKLCNKALGDAYCIEWSRCLDFLGAWPGRVDIEE